MNEAHNSPTRPGRLLLAATGLALLVLAACDSSDPTAESVQIVTYDRPFRATYVQQPFRTDLPAESTTREREVDGLHFSVKTWEVAQRWLDLPLEYRTEMIVTNLRDTSITLPDTLCGLTIVAHRDPQRTGEPVTRSRLDDSWCDSPIFPNSKVTLPPGASYTFQTPLLLNQEDGRYYLSAHVKTGDSTMVVLSAGSIDWYWTHPNLAYHVTLRRERGDPDTLEATLSIENLNHSPVYITWDHWSYYVHAFVNQARDGAPIFSLKYPDIGCRDILNSGFSWCAADATLEPGQAYHFHGWRARFGADEVVPDSLSTGRYYFATEFIQNTYNKRRFMFETGAVDFP